ncbi:MAG: hypothetical protein F2735_07100 [Actinobacteria bacterium]|jgi:hypothetical protein|uniref:Unannotated protein n=1 Tax=freshwater metagenome TaxID=449393 RepID=A0A6J6YHJ2_9ZZZZ|nr:hypothetical protein [Actinomycetota bacterium]
MKSVLLRTFVVSVTLLGLSACGSSSSPAASTPATSDTAAATSDTDGDTDTGGGADEDGGTVPVVTVVGTDDEVRAQITQALIESGSTGFTIDKSCLDAVVAKLSAADVQSFRESFFSPKLSAEGDALGLELENCRTADSIAPSVSATSTP